MTKFLAPILVGLFATVCSGQEENPVIYTKNGPVRGFVQQSTEGKSIYSFMSIPFAASPTGKLRFMPPQPAANWTAVLNGSVEPPFCSQYDTFSGAGLLGQEDCLYLNVYSRQLPENDRHPKLPVMVWIHGGAFGFGSGSPILYSPNILLNSKQKIVLVTINYRLGVLGFLSTADDVVQGNMGLKDQNMALRWVKANIAAFGGDKDQITIAGESAGAASVHLHMISSMSRGLFQRAITQSGSALCPWAYLEPQEIAARSKRLATMLNCPCDDSEAMLSCLQDADANDVAEKISNFIEWYVFPLAPFAPTKEVGYETFIDKSPREIMEKKEAVDVPWMTGNCEFEGELFSSGIWRLNYFKEINDNYTDIFPLLLEYKYTVDNPDKYSNEFRKYYFGDKEISEETMRELTLSISDTFLDYCSRDAVRLQQAANTKSPIYYYLFTFLGNFSLSQTTGVVGGGPSYKPMGATHADDLLYLFSTPTMPPFVKGSDEEAISDMMTAWWVNFVTSGNPNPPGGKESRVIWSPQKETHLDIFNMTLTPRMQIDSFYERVFFLDQIYKDMRKSKPKNKEEMCK